MPEMPEPAEQLKFDTITIDYRFCGKCWQSAVIQAGGVNCEVDYQAWVKMV
jgi:hypothetical protein